MKYDKYRFTLIGGDKRIAALARRLAQSGHTVNACMQSEVLSMPGVKIYSGYEKAVADCDVIILPMPISRDGEHILSTVADPEEQIRIEDVFTYAKRNNVKYILGGNIGRKIVDAARDKGVELIDYSLSEQFLQSNAEATAEGGIMVAMENTDVTVKDSNILVGGYGRIAKHLARLLLSLGAHVTVSARRCDALSHAESIGCDTVRIGDAGESEKFKAAIKQSHIIFNTVPSLIFKEEFLGEKNNSVYIELASCPGGVDLRAARDSGMKIIFAPSLPGRYSPESAGSYIFDSIYQSLNERGIFI
ncbi:MAG: hypothetical protein IJW65_01475 [Clostridia bacterium]|nr:hypothetical protein [Clostridia bacterium]